MKPVFRGLAERASTLGLLILYLVGLILGGLWCKRITVLVMFLPQAVIAGYLIYSIYKKDYITAIAALVMILEIALVVYLKISG